MLLIHVYLKFHFFISVLKNVFISFKGQELIKPLQVGINLLVIIINVFENFISLKKHTFWLLFVFLNLVLRLDAINYFFFVQN